MQKKNAVGERTMEPVTEFEPPAVHHTGCPNNVSYARQEFEHMTTYCISSQLPFLQVGKDLRASSVVDTAVSNEKLVKRIIVIEKKIRAPITIFTVSEELYNGSVHGHGRAIVQDAFGVLRCIVDRFTTSIHVVVNALDACDDRLCLLDARKDTELESRAPPFVPEQEKASHEKKKVFHWWCHSMTIAESCAIAEGFL